MRTISASSEAFWLTIVGSAMCGPSPLKIRLSNRVPDEEGLVSEYRRAYVPGGTYFFTLVTANRIPILTTDLAR